MSAMNYAELTEALLAKGNLVKKLFVREDMNAATIDGLVAEVAYLRHLCATIIDVHAAVVMDTDEDRDSHDRAIRTFRNGLAVAHLAGKS